MDPLSHYSRHRHLRQSDQLAAMQHHGGGANPFAAADPATALADAGAQRFTCAFSTKCINVCASTCDVTWDFLPFDTRGL